jgi:hypothetical protein
MFPSKWVKWAVIGALGSAFPAVAMARVHTHHAARSLTAAKVTHVKKLSVRPAKSHKLTAKHRAAHKLTATRRSAHKLHTSVKRAKPLHSKRHSAIKLHSSRKHAKSMSVTPGMQ